MAVLLLRVLFVFVMHFLCVPALTFGHPVVVALESPS